MVICRDLWVRMASVVCAAALALPALADEVAAVATSDDAAADDAIGADAPATAEPVPTHKQSGLIEINSDGLAEATTLCFCLMADDTLLAGCEGPANEIRVFDKAGKYQRTIALPVRPEAINVAPDQTILVAGAGQLLRLDASGKVLTQIDSPHAEALRENKAELREQVIEQHKQQAESLPQVLKAYDNAMDSIRDQIKELGDEEAKAEQRKALEDMLTTYEDAKKQMTEQLGDGGKELTDDEVDAMVESSLQYKMAVASISANSDAVFIATSSSAGYGYDVWRTSPEFIDGEKIVTDLSGCCGQMDVQANDDGVFVAENSRKRVRRFDAKGEVICEWGKSSEDVDGFGSCCNPMNLAFGKDSSVYTAEDTTGRIKKYSPKGELLSVVGAADVVPGCKKVSIGVDSTGDRIYMLDITRNTIAVLSRVAPDPDGPIAVSESNKPKSGLLRMLGLGS